MLSMKLVFSNQHVSLHLFTSGPTCAYKQKYIFIMAEHDALLLELRAKQNLFFVSLFENMECQVVTTCNMERHVPVLGLQQVKVWLAVARLVLCPSCLPPTPPLPPPPLPPPPPQPPCLPPHATSCLFCWRWRYNQPLVFSPDLHSTSFTQELHLLVVIFISLPASRQS